MNEAYDGGFDVEASAPPRRSRLPWTRSSPAARSSPSGTLPADPIDINRIASRYVRLIGSVFVPGGVQRDDRADRRRHHRPEKDATDVTSLNSSSTPSNDSPPTPTPRRRTLLNPESVTARQEPRWRRHLARSGITLSDGPGPPDGFGALNVQPDRETTAANIDTTARVGLALEASYSGWILRPC